MPSERQERMLRRRSLLSWATGLGAVTAEALAEWQDVALASARAQLIAAEHAGLMRRHRLLASDPSLFTVTAAGVRASGRTGIGPGQVSASNAFHLITCARVAARLSRAYPDRRVIGERELRRDERVQQATVASATIGRGPDGAPLLHRPDLVLLGRSTVATSAQAGIRRDDLPVAVEVELTVKAPRRLRAICRGWARCRHVAGVVYLVAPEVEHALARAVDGAHAGERVVVVKLATLN